MMTSLDLGIDAVGWPAIDRVTHHLGRLRLALHRAVQADVDVAVAFVVGVEGQADGEAVDLEQDLGLARLLIVPDGEQAARPRPGSEVLEDEEAIGPRLGGHRQGLLDGQLGEGSHDLIGGKRVGRADDAGVVEGEAPFLSEGLLDGLAIVGPGGGGDEQEDREEDARQPHG